MIGKKRDSSATDAFLEVALEELLVGRPSSNAERVLHASSVRRARAAAAVDAAEAAAAGAAPAPRATTRGPWRLPTILVAASVLVATLAWLFADRQRTAGPATPGSVWVSSVVGAKPPEAIEAGSPAVTAAWQRAIDRFHSVMPRNPRALRDPEVRRRIAPTAIPVLRQAADLLTQLPDAAATSQAVQEFRIYAMALGDTRTESRVRREAGTRDDGDLHIAAAALIAADDDVARSAALRAVADHLGTTSAAIEPAVRCILVAADLTAGEAMLLSRAATDPDLAARLADAAEWARKDPRHRIGQPLTIAGKLADGTDFSTAAWRGRVVLVHFWASWSASCDHMLADIVRIRLHYLEDEVAIVGVSCDRDRDALVRHLAGRPEMSWPQLFDAEQPGWHALARDLGVDSIPRVFLIDRDGILRTVDVEDGLRRAVARLVDE